MAVLFAIIALFIFAQFASSYFPEYIKTIYQRYTTPSTAIYLDDLIKEYNQILINAHNQTETELVSEGEEEKREYYVERCKVVEKIFGIQHGLCLLLGQTLRAELQHLVFERNTKINYNGMESHFHGNDVVGMMEYLCENVVLWQSKLAIAYYDTIVHTPTVFIVNYVEKRWLLCLESIAEIEPHLEDIEKTKLLQIQSKAIKAMNIYHKIVLSMHAQKFARHGSNVNWELRGVVKVADDSFMRRIRCLSRQPSQIGTLPIEVLFSDTLKGQIMAMNKLKLKLLGCRKFIDVQKMPTASLSQKALLLGETSHTLATLSSSILSHFLQSECSTDAECKEMAKGLFIMEPEISRRYTPKRNVGFVTNATGSSSLLFSGPQCTALPPHLHSILQTRSILFGTTSTIRLEHTLALLEQAMQSWLFEIYNCTHHLLCNL